LRLTIYPVVLGAGNRLFDDITDKTALRRTGTTMLGDTLILATYDVVKDPDHQCGG
jgi:hypothetical protein